MIQILILLFIAIINVQSEGIEDCSWCSTTYDECLNILSEGWTLVRGIGPSHNTWYPQTDRLSGTAPATDNGIDVYNAVFNDKVPGWNQLLLTRYITFIYSI